jgi:hypothetical protein
MLSFGFVSGHDFSRAVNVVQNPIKAGLVHLLDREKSTGAKSPDLCWPFYDPTKVVP